MCGGVHQRQSNTPPPPTPQTAPTTNINQSSYFSREFLFGVSMGVARMSVATCTLHTQVPDLHYPRLQPRAHHHYCNTNTTSTYTGTPRDGSLGQRSQLPGSAHPPAPSLPAPTRAQRALGNRSDRGPYICGTPRTPPASRVHLNGAVTACLTGIQIECPHESERDQIDVRAETQRAAAAEEKRTYETRAQGWA